MDLDTVLLEDPHCKSYSNLLKIHLFSGAHMLHGHGSLSRGARWETSWMGCHPIIGHNCTHSHTRLHSTVNLEMPISLQHMSFTGGGNWRIWKKSPKHEENIQTLPWRCEEWTHTVKHFFTVTQHISWSNQSRQFRYCWDLNTQHSYLWSYTLPSEPPHVIQLACIDSCDFF